MSSVHRRFFLCLIVAMLTVAPAPGLAQDAPAPAAPKAEVDPNLASPRDTILTFLRGMGKVAEDDKDQRAWDTAFKAIDLPQAASDVARRKSALSIYQMLNTLGEMRPDLMFPGPEAVEANKLKTFEVFPDSTNARLVALADPILKELGEAPGKIELVPTEAGWVFSRATVDASDALVQWVKPWIKKRGVAFGPDVTEQLESGIERWVPEHLKERFLVLKIYQWIGLLALIFASVVIDFMSRALLRGSIRRMVRRRMGTEPDTDKLRYTVRPMGLAIGAGLWLILLPYLEIVGTPEVILTNAGRLVLILGLAWAAWALTDLLCAAWERKAEDTDTDLDDILVPLVRKTVKMFVVAMAVLYAAAAFSIEIGPLLASFGLAGLAISFAAQDTVKNLFGGVFIFLDKPFKVGERIKFDGHDGAIEEIGFRITRMRTLDGHVVTIPNGNVTSRCVQNIARRPYIKRVMSIGITYDTPRDKVEQAVDILRGIFEEEDLREPIHGTINGDEFPPRVYFSGYGAFSLDITAIYWYVPPVYWDYMEHGQKVNLRIFEEFEKAGIEFAFPSQTLYLAGDPARELAVKGLPAP